jgi:hypothetical protein
MEVFPVIQCMHKVENKVINMSSILGMEDAYKLRGTTTV